jgi:hypothetical protein
MPRAQRDIVTLLAAALLVSGHVRNVRRGATADRDHRSGEA